MRQRRYTRYSLRTAVTNYFKSITYDVYAANDDGTPILNQLGEKILLSKYAVPPTKVGLFNHLKISKETWRRYRDKEANPDLYDICEEASAKIEQYLEEQLDIREKNVQGLIFNLQNNYGWKNKSEIDIGQDTINNIENLGLSDKIALIREAQSKMEETDAGQ